MKTKIPNNKWSQSDACEEMGKQESEVKRDGKFCTCHNFENFVIVLWDFFFQKIKLNEWKKFYSWLFKKNKGYVYFSEVNIS